MKQHFWLCEIVGLLTVLALAWGLGAQAPPATDGIPPVVESYYKIAPGKTDEWLELYRKEHLPILKEQKR